MTHTIYIKTELTPEVIESLQEGIKYFVIINSTDKEFAFKSWIKDNSSIYTHILLPKEITEQEIESEGLKYYPVDIMPKDAGGAMVDVNQNERELFIEGYRAALSMPINKGGTNE